MVFSKVVDLKLQSTTIIGFGFRLITRIVNASVCVIPTLAILLNFVQELLSSDRNNIARIAAIMCKPGFTLPRKNNKPCDCSSCGRQKLPHDLHFPGIGFRFVKANGHVSLMA